MHITLFDRKTLKKTLLNLSGVVAAVFVVFLLATPTHAQTNGLGPYGDIDGYYTWVINSNGQKVYSQNGRSWIYDNNGNRIYVDSRSNADTSKIISQYNLTYYTTENGVAVYRSPEGRLYTIDADGNLAIRSSVAPVLPASGSSAPSGQSSSVQGDLVVKYVYHAADGSPVYQDPNGNLWYFANGYYPYRYWGGTAGSYWVSGTPDRTFRYSYTADGHPLYSDGSRLWWFASDGAHLYGNAKGFNPPSQQNTNVDWSRSNSMWVNGLTITVYVGQSWQAPTYSAWCPDGMHLIGWDYAEGTGYVRWKPGQYIQNTGSDLALYPVFGW